MQTMAEIIDNQQIAEDIFDMTVMAPKVAETAMPGQFAHIRVRDAVDPLLRRPISICEVNQATGTVRFVFRSHGSGTSLLSSLQPGHPLDIIAPLGGGTFPVSGDFSAVYVIGGGIGVPPLLYAAKSWHAQGVPVYAVLGFAGKGQVILEQEFRRYADVSIYTVDGSYGVRGVVTNYFTECLTGPFLYLACGPKPMLKAVQQQAVLERGTGYLSLEEHMACGVGACMGCVTKIADKVEHSQAEGQDSKEGQATMTSVDWKYAKVCDCGPAFPAEKVVF